MNLAKKASTKLNPMWRNRVIRSNTKLKIFNSKVIASLLYNSKTWRMTETDESIPNGFQKKKSPENFMNLSALLNYELYRKKRYLTMKQIQRKSWKIIGHKLGRDVMDYSRIALT